MFFETFQSLKFSLNKIIYFSHKNIRHLVTKQKIERIFDGVNVSSCTQKSTTTVSNVYDIYKLSAYLGLENHWSK